MNNLIWLDTLYQFSFRPNSQRVMYRRQGADQDQHDYLEIRGPHQQDLVIPVHWRDPETDALVTYVAGFEAAQSGRFKDYLKHIGMFVRNGNHLVWVFRLSHTESAQIPLLNWNRKVQP